MSYSIDDTQPRSPFGDDPANLRPTINPGDEPSRRGSCLLTGVIGGMLLLVAVAIVALAGAAGWTSGQREAGVHATATQNAAISEQLERIAGDVESGNTVLLDARVRWLATQTPGVVGVDGYMMTATALYFNTLPTATPTPAPTTDSLNAAPDATQDMVITPESGGGYDLASILAQAQSAAASSQWKDAADLLDVVIGADPNFERTTVRTLMQQVLTAYARELYNANQPAQANFVVDQAEQYGALADGLEYERYAASLYLKATAAVGTGSPVAIQALQEVINLGPGRYYDQAQQQLYNLYVTRGDAYLAQGDSCTAVYQYQNAINLFASGVANGKRSVAQAACANATPTVDPNIVIPSDGSVAPVGVVQPPGG